MTLEKLNREIRKANKKLIKAEASLDKSIRRRISPLALKDIKQEVVNKRRITNLLISKKLEMTNEEYRMLSQSQRSRFAKSLTFKKYKESASLIISTVNVFDGFLSSNGHLYCEGNFTLRASFISVISPLLFSFVYPIRMEGNIDGLGNISVKVVRYGLAFFKTMPEEFFAEVSKEGRIIINTQKRSSDFIQGHKRMVHRVISSFAFGSETEMACFFETKKELLHFVEEERSRL